MCRKLCQLSLFILLCSPVVVLANEILVASIGCERNTEFEELRSNAPKQYVFLYKQYKSDEKYSKVCKSELGSTNMDALKCYSKLRQDAQTITAGRGSGYFYDSDIVITIQRSTLKTRLNQMGYNCVKSENPQSVLNYVRNAKKKQLDSNQL